MRFYNTSPSLFQLTRPLRGAALLVRPNDFGTEISIHTPLAGRDWSTQAECIRYPYFNSHAPCGARPHNFHYRTEISVISTHTPLAGRNLLFCSFQHLTVHFNSHAPCGARQFEISNLYRAPKISTHTPLAGRDTLSEALRQTAGKFQLTRPLRGATSVDPTQRNIS